MNKKYQQRPAEKPGAMILDELREQEALSQTREALIARHKTKLSSEFKKMEDDIVVECSLELDNEWANESI
tara:strand:- start:108 stop:320 length:213 start_codon:yes stop_codon:yes gene_type:complete